MKLQRLINNIESVFPVARKDMRTDGKTPDEEDVKELEETEKIIIDTIRRYDVSDELVKEIVATVSMYVRISTPPLSYEIDKRVYPKIRKLLQGSKRRINTQ